MGFDFTPDEENSIASELDAYNKRMTSTKSTASFDLAQNVSSFYRDHPDANPWALIPAAKAYTEGKMTAEQANAFLSAIVKNEVTGVIRTGAPKKKNWMERNVTDKLKTASRYTMAGLNFVPQFVQGGVGQIFDKNDSVAGWFISTDLGSLIENDKVAGEGFFIGGRAAELQAERARRYRGEIDGKAFTVGRGIAHLVAQPGTKEYNIISGLVDAAAALYTPSVPGGKATTALLREAGSGAAALAGARTLVGLTDGESFAIDPKKVAGFLSSSSGRKVVNRLVDVKTVDEGLEIFPRADVKFLTELADADTVGKVDNLLRDSLGLDDVTRGVSARSIDDINLSRLDDVKRNLITQRDNKIARLMAAMPGQHLVLVGGSEREIAQTVKNVKNYLRSVKVAPEERARLVDMFSRALVNNNGEIRNVVQEFETVLRSSFDAMKINKPLQDSLLQSINKFKSIYDNDLYGAISNTGHADDFGGTFTAIVDGNVITVNQPLATAGLQSEMLKHSMMLPDPRRTRRLASNLGWITGKAGKATKETAGELRLPLAAIEWAQNEIWRPLTLMTGGYVLRNMTDSMLRQSFAPGIQTGIFHPLEMIQTAIFKKYRGDIAGELFGKTPEELLRSGQREMAEAVGGRLRESLDPLTRHSREYTTDTWRLVTRGQGIEEFSKAVASEVALLHQDDFARLYAQGKTFDDIFDYVVNDPNGKKYLENLQNRWKNRTLVDSQSGQKTVGTVDFYKTRIDDSATAVKMSETDLLNLVIKMRDSGFNPAQINQLFKSAELYFTDYYKTINKFLRDSTATFSARETAQLKTLVSEMDELFKRSSGFETPTILYRGIDSRQAQSLKVGETISEKAFMSTSVDKTMAEGFSKNGFVIEIQAPSGTKFVSPMHTADVNPLRLDAEREVLLPRNTELEIVSISGKNIVAKIKTPDVNRANLEQFFNKYIAPRVDAVTGRDQRLMDVIGNAAFTKADGTLGDAFRFASNSDQVIGFQDDFLREINGIVKDPNIKLKDFYKSKVSGYLDVPGGKSSQAKLLASKDYVVDKFFGELYPKREAFLNRSPVFRKFYYAEVNRLADLLDQGAAEEIIFSLRKVAGKEGAQFTEKWLGNYLGDSDTAQKLWEISTGARKTAGKLTRDQLDAYAKGFALDETKKLFYSAAEKSNFGDMFRVVSPFASAWADVMKRWVGDISRNPEILRRGGVTVQGLKNADPDADGRGFFFKDPQSGEYVFNYPFSSQLAPFMGAATGLVAGGFLGGVKGAAIGALAGGGAGAVAGTQLNGLDAVFQAPAKSLNMGFNYYPGIGPFAQVAANKIIPEKPQLDFVRKMLVPYGAPKIGLLTAPSWADKFFSAVIADPENDRVLGDLVMDTMKALSTTGKYDLTTAEGRDQLHKDAAGKARILLVLRALGQFTGPTRPTVEFKVNTEQGDVYANELSKIFRQYQSENYDTAVQKFMDTFGDDVFLYMAGKTKSIVGGLDASTDFGRWERENSGVVDKYPEVAGYFADVGSNFDYQVYLRQIETGKRDRLNPDELVMEAQSIVGKAAYRYIVRAAGPNPNDAQQSLLREARNILQEQYPGFAQAPLDLKTFDRRLLQLQEAAFDPDLKDNPIAQATQAYLQLRDAALAKAQQRGLTTLGGKTNADLRALLRQAGDALSLQIPEFKRLYDRLLFQEIDL